MFTLEEIASNKKLSREESLRFIKGGMSVRPTCSCLRESETGEESSISCFIPCKEQSEILEARRKLKEATK